MDLRLASAPRFFQEAGAKFGLDKQQEIQRAFPAAVLSGFLVGAITIEGAPNFLSLLGTSHWEFLVSVRGNNKVERFRVELEPFEGNVAGIHPAQP